MLYTIIRDAVRGFFWNLWCGSSTLRDLWRWNFPTSAPDWLHYLDRDGGDRAGFYERQIGGETVCQYYLYNWRHYVSEAWDRLTQERVEWARNAAVNIVRTFTGWVQHGYANFAAWIEAIRNRVGTWVPYFASHLAGAIQITWGRLPTVIRDGRRTFTEWANGLIDDATDWIEGAINAAKKIANDAWNWITSTGSTLKDWWDAAHAWLDDLRSNFTTRVKGALGSVWGWLVAFWNDPYGTVAGWLGDAWRKVLTFSKGAFTFWYNLWANYADDLGEFLTNPFQFLYERAEDWIIEHVW